MGREEYDLRNLDITDYEQFVEDPFRDPRQSGQSPEHVEDFDTADVYGNSNKQSVEHTNTANVYSNSNSHSWEEAFQPFPDPRHPREHLQDVVSLADSRDRVNGMLHHVSNEGQAKVCIGSSQRRIPNRPARAAGFLTPTTRKESSEPPRIFSSLGEKSQVSWYTFPCA
jgi:hypothetical protein